jgi:tRNA dimethylallyltransferase
MNLKKCSRGRFRLSKVIVITGPTATGKTDIAIELAGRIGGEIISADSMQLYKDMDIGTAKPGKDEMKGIRHYLIDEVYPDEDFSVARFKELASGYIEAILKRGKVPIVAGGTGLYINSLIYNINFSETIRDDKLRERLKTEAEERGNEYIHKKLKEIDPEAAKKIHFNDTKRIIRAIEVYEHTRKPISFHKSISKLVPPKHEFILFGLTMNREMLYERINKRVDIMIEKGLIDEVRRMKQKGYDRNSVAMQGLGYKEILFYLRGETTFDEVINILKRNTRRFSKRQLTWFRRNEEIKWFDTSQYADKSIIIKNMLQHMVLSSKI